MRGDSNHDQGRWTRPQTGNQTTDYCVHAIFTTVKFNRWGVEVIKRPFITWYNIYILNKVIQEIYLYIRNWEYHMLEKRIPYLSMGSPLFTSLLANDLEFQPDYKSQISFHNSIVPSSLQNYIQPRKYFLWRKVYSSSENS